MEVLLTSDKLAGFTLAARPLGNNAIDLNVGQQKAIKSHIRNKCGGCLHRGVNCMGVEIVNNKGFITDGMGNPVPSACPSNGDRINV